MRMMRPSAPVTFQLIGVLFACFISPRIPLETQRSIRGRNEPASSQERQVLERLELGRSLDRELPPGGNERLELRLPAGRYAYFTVEPHEIDAAVAVFDTEGQELLKMASPYGVQGPISVSLLGKSAGPLIVEVMSTENNAHSGRCSITLREMRAARKQDLVRIEAQKLAAEAGKLLEKGTTEARKEAVEKYAGMHSRLKGSLDGRTEAQLLEKWGNALNALGDNQKAIGILKSSWKFFERAGDQRGVGMVLSELGSVHNDMGMNKEALAYLNRALLIRRDLNDRRGEAEALEYIGDIYENTSNSTRALESYDAALSIRRAIGDRQGEAESLDDIGVVYDDIDEERKGIEYFAQALPIHQALHDRWGEAISLNNFGTAYDSLGEKRKALEYFAKALTLKRATGNRRGEGTTLSNMCWTELTLAEWQSAMDHCNSALVIVHSIGDREGEAQTLTNIGSIYASAGDPQHALTYFRKGLFLARASGYRLYEGIALNSIGLVFYSFGQHDDYHKALADYKLALSLRRAVADRSGEAATLANIGNAEAALDQKSAALDHFKQALKIATAAESPRWQAASYSNIGWLLVKNGEPQKALDQLNLGLALYVQLGDKNGEAAVLFGIARSKRGLGDLHGALVDIESALKIVETLHSKVTNLQLRTSYLSSVREYYEFYIDLLMLLDNVEPGKGYAQKAFEVSERSRARSLLEILQEGHVEVREHADPELVDREHWLQQLVDDKRNRLARLLATKHSDQRIAAAKTEIDDLLVEQEQLESLIRAKSPEYAALTRPQALSLAQIQNQVLEANTVLLEYCLGSDHSYLWAVTPDSFHSFALPKRTELDGLARTVYVRSAEPDRAKPNQNEPRHHGLSNSEPGDTPVGLTLSRIVLGPVAKLISGRRLAIVADGALQYVPFGMLPEPDYSDAQTTGTPLLIDHEIVHLPSASLLTLLRERKQRRKSVEKTVAVLADPVFDREDSRVSGRVRTRNPQSETQGVSEQGEKQWELDLGSSRLTRSVDDLRIVSQGGHLARLPFTRREAASILALTPQNEGFEALDFTASRKTAIGPELRQYRIVHLATHGLVDSERPELSGLVFSLVDERGKPQNGFVDLQDIYNLDLSAELVVLSACETGLGKEVRGEGLVGLTRGFMYAGAPRVVASLWKVDDVATAELMKLFYTAMFRDGKRPAAALREAQLVMWRQKRWNSPYYWAAFTIQGEWN